MDAIMQIDKKLDTIQKSKALWVLSIVAICVGTAIRLIVTLNQGFWEDEIIAVTHAVQPLPHFFVNIARNDVHPPLYFLQLHFWALVSHADLWFMANSVALGLLAMASLWIVLRRAGDNTLAWTATAFLAVLPAGLWMSQEVRPYAWLSILFIWAYAFAVKSFSQPQTNFRSYIILTLLCLAIIYSHAIGFYAVLFNGLFGFGLLIGRNASPREFLACIRIYGLAAAASVPVMVTNLLHDANLPDATGALAYLSWCSAIITASETNGWIWWGGLLAYLGVAGAGLVVVRTRLMTACLLIAPVLVAVGLTMMLKPIFKPNFFATMIVPFLAIVLAQLCLATNAQVRKLTVAGCLTGFLVLSVAGWYGKTRSTDFLPAATYLKDRMAPGDVVYVPQASMFWGMAWYLAGPDWGSPLEVANPPSPQWQRVYARLGPKLVDLLHLMPATQALSLPTGVTLLTGNASVPAAENAKRLWLVTYPRVDLLSGFPPDQLGSLQKREEIHYSRLVVSFYER
jgi:mannosyltransferase